MKGSVKLIDIEASEQVIDVDTPPEPHNEQDQNDAEIKMPTLWAISRSAREA